MRTAILILWLAAAAHGASVRTVTITPLGQGGTYTNLGSAITAQTPAERNLVGRDEILKFVISGNWTGVAWDNSVCDLTTFTNDATRYIEIYAEGAAKHSGVLDTNRYVKESAPVPNYGIQCNAFIKIHDLQFYTTGTANGIRHGNSDPSVNPRWVEIDRCVFHLNTTAAGAGVYSYGSRFNYGLLQWMRGRT